MPKRNPSGAPPHPVQSRNSELDQLKKEFGRCLAAIMDKKHQYLRRLLLAQTHSVYVLMQKLGILGKEVTPFPLERDVRYERDVFSLGVPAECLRTSLEQLFAIFQIDNSSMSMRSEQSLWLEARETFSRKFVNILELDEHNNVKGDQGLTFMHWLVHRNEQAMLRSLLERNVNMDECDTDGRTPFYLACHLKNKEVVAMFMYYNVSPNESSMGIWGETFEYYSSLIYAASRDDNILGMLIEYAYDQWSDLDINIFLELIQKDSRHLSRFVEIQEQNLASASSIICHRIDYLKFWGMLYKMPSSFLEKILVFFTKNREAFDELMECFSCDNWRSYWSHITFRRSEERENFLRNLHVLASTVHVGEGADEPKFTALQAMMSKIYDFLPLIHVMINYKDDTIQGFEIPFDEMESIMLVLLSNGAPMDNFTMQLIFKEFGDSEFFKFCRLLHVYSKSNSPYHYPANFYHMFSGRSKTMWQVVSDPAQSREIQSNIDYYTSMSSHPNVKEIAYGENSEALTAKVDAQPEFPTLLELARDGARTYVIEKFRVQRSWQFYETLKTLEIPDKLKSIIAYETDSPLYR